MASERTAVVGHSHLFPGARICLDAADAGPGLVHLRMSDGVEITAELLQTDRGQLALSAPEFVTAAGTEIGPSMWLVRSVEGADEPILALGPRMELL